MIISEQERQFNTEARSSNHSCRGRAVSIQYYECVYLYSCLRYSACQSHLFCAALHYHLWPVLFQNIFFTLSHKRYDFWGKKLLNTKCVFWLCLKFCVKHLAFWEECSEILSQMYIRLRVKYPLFLSDFNDTRIFLMYFRKIMKCQLSWKSVQWEASCFMRMDGHDAASSRFSRFCESA